MSTLVSILVVMYWSGYISGLLWGLPIGLLIAVLWSTFQDRRRRVAARAFGKELDQWVRDAEDDKAEARVIGKEE